MRNLSFWSDKLYTNAEIRIFFSCTAKKKNFPNQPLSTTHILSYFFRQQILKGEQRKRGKKEQSQMELGFHGISAVTSVQQTQHCSPERVNRNEHRCGWYSCTQQVHEEVSNWQESKYFQGTGQFSCCLEFCKQQHQAGFCCSDLARAV